jgi:GNAT superfamily N-acetyltransferase
MTDWRQAEFLPVTAERWDDLVRLFGERGACGGCWCMWWRVKRLEFERQKGAGNRQALQHIVFSGEAPGLLAYAPLPGGERAPAGWVSVAPRAAFPALERSRILKPVDDLPVWSVVCFFVDKAYRRQGLTVALLNAAAEYAFANGAEIVEGYPKDATAGPQPDAFMFTGLMTAFQQAGFTEAARRSPTRPIMRRYREGKQP